MSRYARGRQKPTLDVRLPEDLSARFIADLSAIIRSMDGFAAEYQMAEMLSKYCDSTTVSASDRRTAAIEKWMGSERRNSITNQRLLLSYDKDFGWATFDEILRESRRLIVSVIGQRAPYPGVLQHSVLSNGASPRVRRSVTAAVEKLRGSLQLSESAVKHWLAMASSTMLSQVGLELRESSELFTVPKKTEIDRVACKEPEGNALLQRSIGNFIASRLRRVGIDLRDQSRNRDLARSAVEAGLATIDLSSASDSICTQLVLLLFPFDWFSLLDDLRVKTVDIDGVSHDCEMFSSMGNGFTFEIETLIFWALTRSVCKLSSVRGVVSVYGDDIIAPNSIVPRLVRVFHFVGFRTNEKKTNYTGFFRESCGGHYYRGRDVTPFYIRRKITTMTDLILVLNQLLEWDGRGWGFFVTEDLARFHKYWSSFVSPHLYGGVEPDDPSALVTGHTPRWRCVRKTRSVRGAQFSEYHGHLLWHLVRDRIQAVYELDPRIEVGHSLVRNNSVGAVTSWRPYIAFAI